MGHVYPYWQIMLTKLLQGSEQLYPRLCPTLPKALGIYARNCRLSVPAFSGVGAHVRGHESSCTRANYAFFRMYHVFLQESPCFFLLVKDI